MELVEGWSQWRLDRSDIEWNICMNWTGSPRSVLADWCHSIQWLIDQQALIVYNVIAVVSCQLAPSHLQNATYEPSTQQMSCKQPLSSRLSSLFLLLPSIGFSLEVSDALKTQHVQSHMTVIWTNDWFCCLLTTKLGLIVTLPELESNESAMDNHLSLIATCWLLVTTRSVRTANTESHSTGSWACIELMALAVVKWLVSCKGKTIVRKWSLEVCWQRGTVSTLLGLLPNAISRTQGQLTHGSWCWATKCLNIVSKYDQKVY